MIDVCIVLPVQAPYWTERLRVLALDRRFRITLLLENKTFDHRPGWGPVPIEGIKCEVLGASVKRNIAKDKHTGMVIKGVRSIPWRLFGWILKKRPDVIILNNATQMLFASLAAKVTGSRIVLMVEDTLHATRNMGVLRRWTKRVLYHQANNYLAYSDSAIEYLGHIGIRGCIEGTSWSVDVEKFAPTSDGKNCRKDGKGDIQVLFVGAFIERKGILELVKAWRTLSEETCGRARLKLVGSGPLEPSIRALIANEDSIELVGQLKYDAVIEQYQESCLMVLPTKEDLFSLSVVEAMAAGCAVITTPYNGAKELVEEGYNGWIVDPDKPSELKSCLEKALSLETDLARMGRRSLSKARSMDNVVVMRAFGDTLERIARVERRGC